MIPTLAPSALLILIAATMVVSVSGQDYRKYVGQHQRFCGVVADIVAQPFERKCETALLLGDTVERWKLAALLSRAVVTRTVDVERYRGHEICVTGLVTEENAKPYILITETTQITDVREVLPRDPRRLPRPEPPPDVVNQCADGVIDPQVVKDVKPAYTSRAMRDLAQGKVEVQVVIGADGKVCDAALVQTLHPDLDAAAMAAVRKWKFIPASQFGKSVPVLVYLEFTFKLK